MELDQELQKIIQIYENVVKNIDATAHQDESRAYGGVLRAAKGKLQENITESLIKIAWQSVNGAPESLEINSKKISIPIQPEYIEKIPDPEVRNYIRKNSADYVYKLSVDKHVFIDGNFVIAIECKSYAENAMLKRILIDFDFLKKQHPDISCYLFQLESHLGGDYSSLEKPLYGSRSTHTIQSYFPFELNIVTFLEGERSIPHPIHKNFKPLQIEVLRDVVEMLKEDMLNYV